MTTTPFLIVGDGPQESTGLGRIARDLGALLIQSGLPIQVVQLGGTVPPVWTAWPHFPLNPSNEDWGASQVEAFYQDLWGSKPGILFLIWDPARLYAYTGIKLPVQKWTYTAVDAINLNGTIGGPAAYALTRFDRVLGYGRWGGEVLSKVLGPTPYLPHGLNLETYEAPATPEESAWVDQQLGPFYRPNHVLVGMVAANQPRKDFALFFQTIREMRRRGWNAYGWIHTDLLVGKAWSIPQLVEDCGLEKRITVTGTEPTPFTDRQLALMYQRCMVTVLPSGGEGFGYPIVESLASGTICVHTDYAGGAELVPKTEWRVPIREWRVENAYAMQRPVMRAEDWANAVERALNWRNDVGFAVASAYCRGAVTHLDWRHLRPRWTSWIKQGLEGR